MEELANTLQKKYIEDITSKYPLYRFFCAFMFLVTIHAYFSRGETSLLIYLREIKVSFLLDFESGLLSEVSLFHTILAILLAALTAIISSKVKGRAFRIFQILGDFDDYIVRLEKTIASAKPDSEALTWSISSEISKQLDVKRRSLRSKHTAAEISLAGALCLLVGSLHMSWVECILGGAFLLVFCYLQFRAFLAYLSEFLPTYIAEQALLGKKVEFGDGKDT